MNAGDFKVLMLNPPFLPKFSRASRSPAVTKGATIYYPMWLAYAAGVLEKAGFNVMLVDAPARGHELNKVKEMTEKFKPHLIVLDTSTPSIYSDINVLKKLKKIMPKAFCVLVGTHVSALPGETLKLSRKIDAIARHEYDYILRDLAKELLKKKPDLKKVKGITYWEKGKIRHNKDAPLITNLDELPFVSEVYARHLNIYDYFYAANLYPEITILTGRGCPNRCVFCVLPQTLTGHGYRFRSVENVLQELGFIKREFPGVKEVFIEDDTLTANVPRIRKLCSEMIKRKLNITWSANARADVDLETLKLMKKAGCRLLCVGIESGNQQILNNIKKGTTLKGIREFFKATKKAGIMVHGCFMLGNIGETVETLKETVGFAKELDPDTAQFFPIMVYPGTEAFDYFKTHGYLLTEAFDEWLDREGQHKTIVSRPGLSAEELVAWCDEARRQFYLRPKYIASKALQALTKPREMKRILKSGKTFYKYVLRKPKK